VVQGTGEAKDALAQMGIALRDQSGNLRSSERLAGALFDEQQALQARQRLMVEGRSDTERTRTAAEE
jgi:lambda family phage tail tape measure protein